MAVPANRKSTYDKFISNLEKGEVTNLTMQPESGVFEVQGQLKGYADDKHFITYIPNSDSEIKRIQELAGNVSVKFYLQKKQVDG